MVIRLYYMDLVILNAIEAERALYFEKIAKQPEEIRRKLFNNLQFPYSQEDVERFQNREINPTKKDKNG